MYCKSYSRTGIHENGKQMVIADIITKTLPPTLPTDTSELDNVPKDCMLSPGSTLMTTNPSLEIRMMNDEFEWDKL